MPGLLRGHAGKIHFLHQPVHPSDADVYAIITSQDVLDLVSAEPFVIVSIDVEDGGTDFLILHRPQGRGRPKVLVIGAAVYPENPTERLDLVLEAEFMNGV